MTIIGDVMRWAEETGQVLPVTVESIFHLERVGLVVDLVSGNIFGQGDDWWDFAQRWAIERCRGGRGLDKEELAAAMYAASSEQLPTFVCDEMSDRYVRCLRESGWD